MATHNSMIKGPTSLEVFAGYQRELERLTRIENVDAFIEESKLQPNDPAILERVRMRITDIRKDIEKLRPNLAQESAVMSKVDVTEYMRPTTRREREPYIHAFSRFGDKAKPVIELCALTNRQARLVCDAIRELKPR